MIIISIIILDLKNIKDEIKEPIKEEKINKNKNEIICELKLKCKKLEKEIEIYAKKWRNI